MIKGGEKKREVKETEKKMGLRVRGAKNYAE